MAEDNINLRAGEITEWGTTLAPITKYLEPQNPIKKVDISTGNVNYIYPLTTDKQVILEDKTRLNTKITQLNAAILELNDLIAQVDQDISNAQSKAEAAQTTADSAVTKANTAQSTADTAVSKANAAQTTANNAMPKSPIVNPISSSEDTVTKWTELGSGFYWVTQNNVVQNQPNTWGFICNIVFQLNGSHECYQFWLSQPGGDAYTRGGNNNNWAQSWVRLMNKNNFSVDGSTLNISI